MPVVIHTTDVPSLIKTLTGSDGRTQIACCKALINLTAQDEDRTVFLGFSFFSAAQVCGQC